MARKQCQVCGQPATVRVEANLNGRNSTMLLCDDHYRQLVRQQKRTVSPLEALFGSRSGLFEDFLGSDFFRIGEDATPVAADTDDVVDASFGEPATAGSGAPRRRGSGLASRISEQSEALLQEAAKHAAEFGRSEVDTEHLLLALADSDVVKTILGQFKIKVDDLKRQIESEAKRGDKPFEGEIGVSPRVKDALSRAFVASNELGHSYVGPEHFLIGLAEEGEGLAANLLRRYGLTERHARALLRLEGDAAQRAALEHIASAGLTVAQTEQYIERLLAVQPKKRKPTYLIKDVRLFLNSLSRGLSVMQGAGIDAQCAREETDETILLTIRIPKTPAGAGRGAGKG